MFKKELEYILIIILYRFLFNVNKILTHLLLLFSLKIYNKVKKNH